MLGFKFYFLSYFLLERTSTIPPTPYHESWPIPISTLRRRDADELSSSGYSSTVNAEYYPVTTETMDTEDYELYDPRLHTRPRVMQPRATSSKAKPKEVVCTLSNSGKRKSRISFMPVCFFHNVSFASKHEAFIS